MDQQKWFAISKKQGLIALQNQAQVRPGPSNSAEKEEWPTVHEKQLKNTLSTPIGNHGYAVLVT